MLSLGGPFRPIYGSLKMHAQRQLGARLYSPVRSRVPMPPRVLLRKSGPTKYQSNEVAKAAPQRNIIPEVQQGVPMALLNIMREPTLVFERRLEMMNVFLGFEQANHYTIYSPEGHVLGYMEEDDLSFTRAIMRQIYRLHRPFTVNVYDANGQHALTIKRPFSFINSHIQCYLPGSVDEAGLLSESRQEWHLWRRRYNLYQYQQAQDEMDQFARVDAPFLSFSFPAKNDTGKVVGAVDRNWVGLAREMFTDTGVYVVRSDPAALESAGYTDTLDPLHGQVSLAQRCALLATAVSIDFDYFSRHSSRGPGIAEVE